jgi:hypothetical protein
MGSLQEKAICTLLCMPSQYDIILKKFILRTIDLNEFSESALFLIWYRYSCDSEILAKIPSWYMEKEKCRQCGDFRFLCECPADSNYSDSDDSYYCGNGADEDEVYDISLLGF